MIYFVTTRHAEYTIGKYLATHGAELVGRIMPIRYGTLVRLRRPPGGTYVFADVERLTPGMAHRAARVHQQLLDRAACRVLNHPLHTMRRFELLRTLHDRGVNEFNVYRVSELTRDPGKQCQLRYPVFVRGENDHKGAQSPLLHNEAELLAALRRLRWRWKGWRPKIVTEFCDVSDAQGVFRKYAAFKVGERILARHIFFSDRWSVKAWRLLDAHLLAEERQYFDANPHEAELREIFALARIEFGRIDYSFRHGRLQVWEINTNPMLPVDFGGGGPAREQLHEDFRPKMRAAFEAIDRSLDVSDRQAA